MLELQKQLKKRVQATLVNGRVDWADYSKGICIFLVVMMHAVLGVEKVAGSEGWMHAVTTFAKPFRMPDFFMISGLFLALTINVPWRRFLDRKVIHFAYFYVLWLGILVGLRIPSMLSEGQSPADIFNFFVFSLIQPFGTLWFIYMLPIFLLTTRLIKSINPLVALGAAAFLQILPINTGSMVIDEFCALYFFFLFGYLFGPRLFDLAKWTVANPAMSLGILGLWALINGVLAFTPSDVLPLAISTHGEHLSDLPFASLILGLMGAMAILMIASLLTQVKWAGFLGYMGANSIVIYLAFTFPNSIMRSLLLKYMPGLGIGNISLIVTLSCVVVPLIMHYVICKIGYGRFLFERPDWAKLDGPGSLGQNGSSKDKPRSIQPAE